MPYMLHAMVEDPNKPTVIMLVGLPGSGKGYFAQDFKEEQKEEGRRARQGEGKEERIIRR